MERLTERIKRLQKDDLIVYTNGKYEDTIPAEMTNDEYKGSIEKTCHLRRLRRTGLACEIAV